LGLRNSSAQMLPPHSVILSSRAPIGHLVINNESMATNQGCKGLIPRSELQHKFLYYYLSSIVDLLNSLGTGATFKELSGGKLKEVTIPVPPLAEQQRIVGLLDEAFAGLATAQAHAEKNHQNARALFESHLQSVFTQRGKGWVEKPFSELCDIKHGYAFEGEFFSTEGEYVLLTPGNFYERGGYRDRGEKQKYFTGEIPRDYVLNEGDLLVAMTEQAAGLLGSPILVPESDKFQHNQRLGLVTKKPGAPWTNEFFFHVFNTQPVRNAIHASASGVKVRHTSPTKIGEVVVAFPTSLTEQKRIVSTLSSLSAETQRLATLYERKQAALAALKQSLLHQAFTGAL
jgi:type I restriction enzyme, S subunit